MEKNYILGIDQGSTGSKVMVVDREGEVVCSAYREIGTYYPQDGWLEHDPDEIWHSIGDSLLELAQQFDMRKIRALGITNQRETSILWDRSTGQALTRAISWQCTRSQSIVDRWQPFADQILETTGLLSNTYFSASKIAWMLENDRELDRRARAGELCFGNVNSWILWNLTGGKQHLTDSANAGRTLLFDVRANEWDLGLMGKMNIPPQILPEVRACDAEFGVAVEPAAAFPEPVPVLASIGDQMSALFGQACFQRGEAKCSIGTSLNLVTYTGQYEAPQAGILPAIACNRSGKLTYELEGGVYTAGSVNGWLIDQLGIAANPREIDAMAVEAASSNGIYFVPAFQGLGAPHWNPNARALIIGLSRFHDKRHICRAALESIALQTNDVMETLCDQFGLDIPVLKVDGGVAKSNIFLQMFSDILGRRIERPRNTDRTPMGAVFLAGLSAGVWSGEEELRGLWKLDQAFEPQMSPAERSALLSGWKEAVTRSYDWVKSEREAEIL